MAEDQTDCSPVSSYARPIDRITGGLIVLGIGWVIGMPLVERHENAVAVAFVIPIVAGLAAAIWWPSVRRLARNVARVAMFIVRMSVLVAIALLRLVVWIIVFVGIPILLLFIIVRLVHFFWYW